MSKLAVFFPGIGYTVDKPLLHYCRRIASELGYEILLLPYSGFPAKVKGDRDKMVESYQIALRQAQEMLADVDLSAYEDVLFVGKSIGTIVAAQIAAESSEAERIRFILYTPLEDTFSFPLGEAITFTGTADPWVGKEETRIPALCEERDILCKIIPGANHSLETDDLQEDIRTLRKIMKKTMKFIKG